MSFPLFVDISQFQPSTPAYFKTLKNRGVTGAFIRINYGDGFPDSTAGAKIRQSTKYLDFTGCYAFFLGNPVAEAHYFLAWVKAYGMDKTTPVMLDVEENQSYNGPQTHLINEWTSIVYAAGYHNIWIYSMASWLNDGYHVKPELLKHGHVWAAAYGTDEPGVQADAWQFTDNLFGMNTDGDYLFKPLSVMTGSSGKTKPKAKKPIKKVSKPKPKSKPKVQKLTGTFKVTGTIERLK